MGAEERVGKNHVHPPHQVGVTGRIRLCVAIGGNIGSRDATVHAAHEGGPRVCPFAVGKRRGQHPPHRAGEAAEWVFAITRPVVNPGHSPGMQRLHQQRTDAADQHRRAAIDRPHGRPGPEVSGVIPLGQLDHPLRCAIGRAGERREQISANPARPPQAWCSPARHQPTVVPNAKPRR